MDQLAQEYPLDVTYKSYYLRPDIPPEGYMRPIKEGEKVGGFLTGHIGEIAAEAGLTMRRAPLTPNTRMAFEASAFAKSKGLFEHFHRACYKALWEDGADLGQLSVLQYLGEQVGLDAQDMKDSLGASLYASETKEQYHEALSIGVSGIPSFIIGGYFFSGVQPYEFFKKVVEMGKRRLQLL
ncbi:DsbA family protein [Dehalococcoidia bacterium]|nr:DsbA family protein [Dehalococcoidia bacterium]